MWQIVEVSDNNLRAYLGAGFEIYTGEEAPVPVGGNTEDGTDGAKTSTTTTAPTTTTPEGGASLGLTKPEEVKIAPEERALRVEFLKQMGVNVMNNWRDETVVKKSDEMGYTADLFDPSKTADDGSDEEEDGTDGANQ